MVRDLVGPILVLLTWILMTFGNYVTVTRIFNFWFTSATSRFGYTTLGSFLFILYETLNIVAIICHLRAVFGNPGTTIKYVPTDSPEGFQNPRICKPCGSRWKPPRAHHCRKCRKCIFRMDHHCAWIDNCVGIANQKFFILFLVYAAILCGYQLFLLILTVIFWIVKRSFSISFVPAFLGLCVLFESITFLYMTTDFLAEQIDAIETNSTLVESHQHTHGTRKDVWKHLAEIFGKDWRCWLLPTRPDLELDFTEPVFLDKAVADQLRYRQRMLQYQKDRHKRSGKSAMGHDDLCSAATAQIRGQKVTNEHESEFVENSGFYTEQLMHWHEKHPGQHLRQRHQKQSGRPEEEEQEMNSSDFSGSEGVSDGAIPSNNDYDSDSDNREQWMMMPDDEKQGAASCEEQFKNVYLKPWADIGVEIEGDHTQFVHLTDLEDEEDEENERNEKAQLIRSSSSCSRPPTCHRREHEAATTNSVKHSYQLNTQRSSTSLKQPKHSELRESKSLPLTSAAVEEMEAHCTTEPSVA